MSTHEEIVMSTPQDPPDREGLTRCPVCHGKFFPDSNIQPGLKDCEFSVYLPDDEPGFYGGTCSRGCARVLRLYETLGALSGILISAYRRAGWYPAKEEKD